jgi:hypothetical protein
MAMKHGHHTRRIPGWMKTDKARAKKVRSVRKRVAKALTKTGALTPGYTIPNPSTAAWANVAAALVKGGMSLAQIQAIQPGTVVSANGAILRQATGLAVPVPGATNLGLGLSTTGSSSLLLLGGAALLVLLLMQGKGR